MTINLRRAARFGLEKKDHFGGTKISPARYGRAELTALHSI